MFRDLAKMMDLYDENAFKVRSYQSAYQRLRTWPKALMETSEEEFDQAAGIGKGIKSSILEIIENGQLAVLESYKNQTPPGILDLLSIRGIGPKKVKAIWKEMGIDDVHELIKAIENDELLKLKGFAKKTQDDILKKLEYHLESKDKYLLSELEPIRIEVLERIGAQIGDEHRALCGALRRESQISERIEILINVDALEQGKLTLDEKVLSLKVDESIDHSYKSQFPLRLYGTSAQQFHAKLLQLTGPDSFVKSLQEKGMDLSKELKSENDYFEQVGLAFIPPEYREEENLQDLNRDYKKLVTDEDILGTVHCHTVYSDGTHTVRQMAEAAAAHGHEYIVITDHSKTAFYANGLKEEELIKQWDEIDAVNKELDIHIFRGIESDILNDGSLDYPEEILQQFDLIIGSIHSNLNMKEAVATERLIKAIENPYMKILGHLSGRILLSRKAYPLDYEKIIDACAANEVSIELNANPHRLDLDWKYIRMATEKDVLISINPDAHSIEGIDDIKYGVRLARKAGLKASECLNSYDLREFEEFIFAQ